MKEEQLNQYAVLQQAFEEACKKVIPFVSKVSKERNKHCDDIANAEYFWLDTEEKEVAWRGGYWYRNEYTEENGWFDANLLTMSEGELKIWVTEEIAKIKGERAAEESRKHIEQMKRTEEKERAEYERLKAKFG